MATDKKIFPKQQLEIVQVQDPKSYSGGTKTLLPVMAKNLSLAEGDPGFGKSWKYTVFNQDLQDHIKGLKVGDRRLCDIEEHERPDSEYGPDRNIVQIYVEGKPVSQKKGGGGGYGKSPEMIRLEHELDLVLEGVKRRSIEGQTAIAQVGAVLSCPNPIPGEALGIDEEGWFRILDKYWLAVERSLDVFLAEPKAQEPAPKRDQRAQDTQGKGSKAAAVVSHDIHNPPVEKKNPPPDPVKHVGDLLTRSLKLKPPVTRDELCVGVNVNDPKEIKDLEAAWKTAQELSASKVQGKPKADEEQLPF